MEFQPDRWSDIDTEEQYQLEEELRHHMIEIIEDLDESEYAYISLDRVAFAIGIYTPDPEQVKLIVEKHPHDWISIYVFFESFSQSDNNHVIQEIYNLPFVKQNREKLYNISTVYTIDRYDTINITLIEPIPELEAWVKQADYGPIRIVFKEYEKFLLDT